MPLYRDDKILIPHKSEYSYSYFSRSAAGITDWALLTANTPKTPSSRLLLIEYSHFHMISFRGRCLAPKSYHITGQYIYTLFLIEIGHIGLSIWLLPLSALFIFLSFISFFSLLSRHTLSKISWYDEYRSHRPPTGHHHYYYRFNVVAISPPYLPPYPEIGFSIVLSYFSFLPHISLSLMMPPYLIRAFNTTSLCAYSPPPSLYFSFTRAAGFSFSQYPPLECRS